MGALGIVTKDTIKGQIVKITHCAPQFCSHPIVVQVEMRVPVTIFDWVSPLKPMLHYIHGVNTYVLLPNEFWNASVTATIRGIQLCSSRVTKTRFLIYLLDQSFHKRKLRTTNGILQDAFIVLTNKEKANL